MMKPIQPRPKKEMTVEVTRLAREVEEQIGEDNVMPWLLVHHRLVQTAVLGYRIGLRDAVQRVQQSRN